jgi:hypothetical protein
MGPMNIKHIKQLPCLINEIADNLVFGYQSKKLLKLAMNLEGSSFYF